MRIATWNVNDVNKRLPLLLAWLEATQPDVVALQELKCTDAAFPADVLRAAGYGALWVGQKTWNGVALLSRGTDPVPIRRALPGDSADRQARYIEAAVRGVIVASIYLPNGNPYPGPRFDYKQAWFARLLAHAQTLWDTGHPVVLAGDYNVVPTDLDTYPSTSHRDNALLQAEPRQAWRELLAQGWMDTLREMHPHERLYTFWDYMRQRWQRNAGLRIDHVLLSRVLQPRLKTAGVDRDMRDMDGASDHAPVWVEMAD